MSLYKKTAETVSKALASVANPADKQPQECPAISQKGLSEAFSHAERPDSSSCGFVPYESYALSVSIREATRGYGKATPDSKKGNRRLLYVEVDGWDGLAVCNVTDREQWKPHDRLEGRFVKMRPDYCLEFAYMPGRRAGK